MKIIRKGESGLEACEDAFKRLIEGSPVVSQHVGLDASKLTAGVVSVEAGFDRGYLKKARKTHQSLLAKIEAYRICLPGITTSKSDAETVRQTLGKLNAIKSDLVLACQQRDRVLTQNLQLCERVRELEIEIAEIKNGFQQTLKPFFGCHR